MTRKVIRVLFGVLGLFFVVGIVVSLGLGTIGALTGLPAVLVVVSFLFLNYLLADALVLTRDRLYAALLVALFIWPIVTSGVSYYLTGAETLHKKGLEYRIGGFGDCLTVGFMLGVEGLNQRFLYPSLLLMLGTNIALLAPVLTMYSRAQKKVSSQSTRAKGQQ